MRRHIEMEDAAGANFHNDEHIDQAESCRHNNEEITCNDGFRMVANKCHPALGGLLSPRLIRHVSAHCAQRNLNSDLRELSVGLRKIAAREADRMVSQKQ